MDPIMLEEINEHTSKEFVDLINLLKPAGKKIITTSSTFVVPDYVEEIKISGCGAGSTQGYAGQYVLGQPYSVYGGQELEITVGMGNTVIKGLSAGTVTLVAGGYRGAAVVTDTLGYKTGYDGESGKTGSKSKYINLQGGSGGAFGLGGAFGFGGGGGGGGAISYDETKSGGGGGSGGENPDVFNASSSRKYSGANGNTGGSTGSSSYNVGNGGNGGNAGGYGAGGGRGGDGGKAYEVKEDNTVNYSKIFLKGGNGSNGSPTQGVVIIEWGNT